MQYMGFYFDFFSALKKKSRTLQQSEITFFCLNVGEFFFFFKELERKCVCIEKGTISLKLFL